MEVTNAAPTRVSDDLRRILDLAAGGSLSIGQIVAHTHGRGLPTIVIILCLPFLLPVSIPGLSIPFGVAVALCGMRIALRHDPWLPAFIAERQIPSNVLQKVLGFGMKVYLKVERLLAIRWTGLTDTSLARLVAGSSICLSAVLLSLPIPPPFPLTNTIPGVAIIFVCLGLLERDGLLVLLGYLLACVALAYVVAIGFLGGVGVTKLWEWVSPWLGQ